MASKYSPDAPASPILVATVVTAGVLLLLEMIHHQLPNIIASFHQRPHSAFAVAVILLLILVLNGKSHTASGDRFDRQPKIEGQHD